jgi:Plavaka transposase
LVERLGLSYKNSNELNKIIDNYLPGRPAFKRHEVMVGNEVCEVFFRDIIACIRALFGDPNFAAVMVLVPEKHYTNQEKKVRM